MNRVVGFLLVVVLGAVLGFIIYSQDTPTGSSRADSQGDSTKKALPAPKANDALPPQTTSTQPVVQQGEKTRIAVVGDFGDPGGPASVVAAMVKSWNVSAVATTGDNNYPQGALETFGPNTHAHYGAFIDTGRFFPALGNHDWGQELNYSAETLPHSQYFTYLPGNKRYYEIVVGLTHLFIIDSDIHEPDGRNVDSVQANWLRERLAASPAPYKLIFMHESPYSSCKYGDTQELQWPYKDWGATVVFSAHCHFYERLDIGGLPYIINGLGGGGGVYDFVVQRPESVVQYNANRGAVLIEATAQQLVIQFITVSGEVIDTLTIAN